MHIKKTTYALRQGLLGWSQLVVEISSGEYTCALSRIPDEELFPQLPEDSSFVIAPDDLPSGPDKIYTKRPRLRSYEHYKEEDCLCIIPSLILEEAQALQRIFENPHPNLIKYHGCRARRGLITGLDGVRHLHAIDLAHNDISPSNILISLEGMPVLVDFGSCKPHGEKLTASRGTVGWIDEKEEYATSEARHDLFAIEKIRKWLENPTFRQ